MTVDVRRRVGARVAAALVACCLAGGCAAGRHRPVLTLPGAYQAPGDSLEDYMSRVRALSAHAVPDQTSAKWLEQADEGLSMALHELFGASTAEHHRAVADNYARLRVFDAAFDHYNRALRLDKRDAASYEGLARIWREWGLPHLGLADAHRAIFYAPFSSSGYNTLGTLLEAMHLPADARKAFQHAAGLDPTAGYAFNNLCYLSFSEGHYADAEIECRHALTVDPDLQQARQNLTRILAAQHAADPVVAQPVPPNAGLGDAEAGMMLLANRRYAEAAAAFNRALAIDPASPTALIGALWARLLAAGSGTTLP